jgi:hypothetical protein
MIFVKWHSVLHCSAVARVRETGKCVLQKAATGMRLPITGAPHPGGQSGDRDVEKA